MHAQTTFPVNGIAYKHDLQYVFLNATLHVDHQTVIDSATMIIRKGLIEEIGKGIKIPEGGIVTDLHGMHIYPSFIDPYSGYGMPANDQVSQPERKGPQINSNTKGAFSWNQALKPETEGHRIFVANEATAEAMRNAGFGLVLTLPQDGIARGTGCLVTLGAGKENDLMVKERAASALSFKKGSSKQEYPTSEMGAIALLRQSYLDAQWYAAGGNKEERNISIQSWVDQKGLPCFFECDNYLQSLRADKIGDEFGVKYVIKGSGDEYKRLEEIKKTGNPYVLPLRFPDAFHVSDPFDSKYVSLEDLLNWEQAPHNAKLLDSAGVKIAFTSFGLKDPAQFIKRLRQMKSTGMSSESLLKACFTTPAELLGISNMYGSLKKGMVANFIVTNNDILNDKSQVLQNWIKGIPYLVNPIVDKEELGSFKLRIGGADFGILELTGNELEMSGQVIRQADTTKARVSIRNGIIKMDFEILKPTPRTTFSLSGYSTKEGFQGKGMDGIDWQALRVSSKPTESPKDSSRAEATSMGPIRYPSTAYGFVNLPKAETVLIRNATVWTNEKEGVLKNTDVLIQNGKITAVGTSLTSTGAKIIDGSGMHLTAGIIDEHSHIAVSQNVNECSHAVTSEVRIGDVLDPDDINIYRQLAGGVTTSQLLHGSCNPIGGQSAIIKLRWGRSAESMKFENAPGFIKFALGENVKQSNWGDDFRIRYPQTRMGVEQVYVDAFTRAIEYNKKQKASMNNSGAKPFRRDLRLEALSEILDKKRNITCHSYQQGEITMLMRVADSLGFRVNTFTHILEGYKVADKMKEHGVGASSFSDWWAYKYEVIEAIPYNGSILHDMGITVAYNSDDAEMARRLNQEAAKAVRYGGVSEEEALKFVTLNPAKLLHIDDRVGSIKVGKDADVVLWTENPLSVYAKASMTFIDGICYFDASRDMQLRKEVENERMRIMNKMRESAKNGGSEVRQPTFKSKRLFHCVDEEVSE